MSGAGAIRSSLCLTAVALAGCSDSRGTTAGPSTATAAPSAAPASSSATASPGASPTPTAQRCEHPEEGYALRYPADWFVATDPEIEPCTFFDDRLLAIEPRSEATGVAIRVDVRDVPLEQARRDSMAEGEKQAQERTAGGRRAFRVTGVLTEEVLLPAGTRITSWLVEDGSRTILLHADDAAPGDYERTVGVLDEMAQSLEVR